MQARLADARALEAQGINVYPTRSPNNYGLVAAVALLEQAEREATPDSTEPSPSQELTTKVISIAGRIMGKRDLGKVTFIDLKSNGHRLQVQMRRDLLGNDFDLLKHLSLGDFIGSTGPMFRTRRGEPTLAAHSFTVLTKALRPPPEKWAGLKDLEERRRKRYLDLMTNDLAMRNAKLRSAIVHSIRSTMHERAFVEVETPILTHVAAGAAARPFATHHNALNKDLYLRIATELPLKKLLVGGLERVFELGRVFRNEGIDHDHNPEFTTIEAYQAYASYEEMMELTEMLVYNAAYGVTGKSVISDNNGPEIDLKPPWVRLDLASEVHNHTGIDLAACRNGDGILEETKLRSAMSAAHIAAESGASTARLLDKVVSAGVEPHLVQPSFLLDYPVEMSPLAKRKRGPHDPTVERFEAFMLGMEIANAFTELNDPIDQRQRMEEQERIRQTSGDEETDRLDEDFLIALEYGMPPAGGLGLGIDRLTKLLAGESTIREVILFPTMRS